MIHIGGWDLACLDRFGGGGVKKGGMDSLVKKGDMDSLSGLSSILYSNGMFERSRGRRKYGAGGRAKREVITFSMVDLS